MNNINIVDKNRCCGCGACYNKCPVGAITMQENEEGFLAPIIDETKCTNCGLCKKACPALNVEYKNNPKPDCYAAMADDEIRMKSSSGGVFTLLAENILDKGGYVCGAAFETDWSVSHIIIDNKGDLEKLRGSKYVQSDTKRCYSEIKKLLDNDKYVLFSGCPCQVAGLLSFLGKEYEKLLTVDILCHGSPSRGIWKKYLKENFDISEIKNLNFRDKSKIGWSCSHLTITKTNGEQIVSDLYTKPFHRAITMRNSCENCEHSKLPRPADITIGDFWGISEYNPQLNDSKGTSLVLINSKIGEKIFNEIKCQKYKITLNRNYNNGHIKIGLKLDPKRDNFFKKISKMSFNKIVKPIVEDKYDVCLLTTFWAENYGAILVAYAVNYITQNMGYSVLMLPATKLKASVVNNKIPMNFAKKHYNISHIVGKGSIIDLNNCCKNFVVGSDQMFHYNLHQDHAFLDFVKNTKNKIAFGTSFGRDAYLGSIEEAEEKRILLKRFNHIALRETGENLNKIFDFNPEEVIDPTLMIPGEHYSELAKDASVEIGEEPYLLTYTLDLNEEKANIINYLADKLKLRILNIPACFAHERKYNKDIKYIEQSITPEDFIKLYENASFVVSDSYHGTCFAVKFNKPFVSIINIARGGLRYKLFDKLLVKDRIIENFEQAKNPELLKPVDYSKTNEIVEKETNFALNWLDKAIKNNNSNEKFTDFDNYADMKIKELQKQLTLLKNKSSIYRKYYRYKILSKILTGKKRGHYKEKAAVWHEKVRKIRKFCNQ